VSFREMVEGHTHGHMLPYDALEAMAKQGVTRAVSCAIVLMAEHAESYFDHFKVMRDFYRPLALSAGVNMYFALGIHPAGIPRDWQRVLKRLPEFLAGEEVVAVGEIGMNQDSQLEKDVFRAQLEVAKDWELPVIVHTPKQHREYIVDVMLDIAFKAGIAGDKLIIDHAHTDIIGQINGYGAIPGLTIREQNLTPEQLVENLESFAGGILNSDFSNLFNNNPIGMLDAVDYMIARGVDPGIIASLARDKAVQIYGL